MFQERLCELCGLINDVQTQKRIWVNMILRPLLLYTTFFIYHNSISPRKIYEALVIIKNLIFFNFQKSSKSLGQLLRKTMVAFPLLIKLYCRFCQKLKKLEVNFIVSEIHKIHSKNAITGDQRIQFNHYFGLLVLQIYE